MTRRSFVTAVAALGATAACGDSTTEPIAAPTDEPSRLRIVNAKPTKPIQRGIQSIGLFPPLPALQRDGLLYIPSTYVPSEPLPLVVLLHGAGGAASNWFGSYQQRAEDARVVMLAPDARSAFSWDVIEEQRFGPDVTFIERAIASTFARCAIDINRMALIGYSDGASYALSLGLANGDLFKHVIAHSPGAYASATRHGAPDFFFSHGTTDSVLPIDQTSRLLVPAFRAAGLSVTYVEFEGGHLLPGEMADVSMQWLSAAFKTR